MTEALVLVILVWAGMLVPSALRSRNASPHVTVGGFERAMGVLSSDTRFEARPTATAGRARRGAHVGRQVLVPRDAGRIVERPVDSSIPPAGRVRREDPVVARRRAWFQRALVASAVTLVLALAFGGWLWLVTGLVLALSAGYVGVLRRLKLQRDEARRVVRDLELHRDDVRTIDLRDADVAVGAGASPTTSWGGSGTVRLRRWDD